MAPVLPGAILTLSTSHDPSAAYRSQPSVASPYLSAPNSLGRFVPFFAGRNNGPAPRGRVD